MEKEHKEAEKVDKIGSLDEREDTTEAVELILYQVSECYVYLIPPRKSAASYRFYSTSDSYCRKEKSGAIVEKKSGAGGKN